MAQVKNTERIRNAKTLAAYYNALNEKNKAAWDHIFSVPNAEPMESLAEYIHRTGCRTEERTSKNGTLMIKVYFENGDVKEYEKSRIDTIYAYLDLEE